MSLSSPSERSAGPPTVSPALARRSLPELPLAAVLLVCALGLLVVYLHHFRLGSLVIACGVLLASALRLSVSARRAGLLVVRSRALDVTVLAALGVAVLVLALVVPSMHP